MNWMKAICGRLRALFQKQRLDREMNEELRFHIERQTEANVQAGMNPKEAHYAALRKFGWMESIRDDCRDLRRVRWIEDLLTDVRFAVRMLKNHPGFTTVAVLSLALGIGGTTGIFGVVNAVLLNPLPQKDPQRLVQIASVEKEHGWASGVSPQTWQELRQMGTFFSDLVVDAGERLLWEGENFVEDVDGARVSPNFFGFWQLRPQLGRTFTPEEDKPEDSPVIILSHEFWQNQCRGRPEVVGQSIHFRDKVFTVIGVMPPDVWGGKARFWLPFRIPTVGSRKGYPEGWDYHDRDYRVAARLQPGVTTQQLQAVLETIAQRQATDSPETSRAYTLRARPLRLLFSDEHLQQTLLSLFGAIGFVLLIACANIANLLLARNEARQRELAVRVAIGAGRWRLVRQLLTESIVLAVLGGVSGLFISWWGARLLQTFIPFYLPSVKPIGFDMSMLGFTLVLSLGVGIALGLIQAWLASRRRLEESLKSSAPLASQSVGRKVGGGLLVISELALAVVLLTGAGLMVNSVVRLLHVNPGFDPTNLLKVDVWAHSGLSGTVDQTQQDQLILQIRERFAALPGVEAVGVGLHEALDWREEYQTEGHNTPIQIKLKATGVGNSSELKAMRVPLLSGRLFDTSDAGKGQKTVIVNETLARFCWPGQAAVGKRLRSIRNKDEVLEVVGVVGDIRDGSYDQYVGPICYTPFASFPNLFHQRFSLFVRTRVDPVTLIATLRRELQAMAPPGFRTPVFEVVTQSLYENTAQRRLYMGCLSGFAAIGVILSVIGIYGVLAWTVTRRTKEIGIRMACGASSKQVLGLVLRQGLFMTSIGIMLGLAAATALTRFLSSYLFGVGPLDPITFSGASLLLGAVALLACYVPARRAARIDPMMALRYE